MVLSAFIGTMLNGQVMHAKDAAKLLVTVEYQEYLAFPNIVAVVHYRPTITLGFGVIMIQVMVLL